MKEIIEKVKEQVPTAAFPFVAAEMFGTGMTLRDYFAAKVMQGIIGLWNGGVEHSSDAQASAAEAAYQIADAMLKAREKNT